MTTPAPAIEAHDLIKTYPGGVTALDGMAVTVAPGTVFGLLGPNGAGKSTTVKILTTLARPDSGTAPGRRPRRAAPPRPGAPRDRGGGAALRRRPGGHRPGEPASCRGGSTGCAAPPSPGGPTSCWSASTWWTRPSASVKTYSGGMQRRLDVALGLVHRPEVLFLDEPTTGLDPEARTAMWEEITRLAGDEGLTILLTTHYLEEADRLAERIAIVDRGRVVTEGTPDELKGELRGDAVQVELAEPVGPVDADLLETALAEFAGVRDAVVDGRRVSARADNGAAAVPQVLAVLEREGAAVASVTVARPSLDDVYLRYAGRRFSDANADSASTQAPAATGGAR